jgi:hypothetical protein
LSACAAVIRRLNWGWRIHFQDITLLWLPSSCCMLAVPHHMDFCLGLV